jgi:hypothetical protein
MRRILKWVGVLFVLLIVALGVLIAIGPPKASPEAIANSVDRTPALMEKARALPAAATYEAEPFWQSNGSLCGPASLVNVRRSLGLEAANEDAMLEGTGKCSTGMCFMGLTLDELAEVAGAHADTKVTVLRDLSAEDFHEHLRRSNDPNSRYVVNFSRGPIFGKGVGHHSPIAGYLEDEDKVLVIDVNQDYKPWLIERDRLFEAMDTLDGDLKRGLLLIEPAGS